ncbi:hypothetical protein SAMN02910447_01406 [Ruminococcus sp. YE71]|nr:hypothetical protein SAMN02910446_01568 [Ruminococcus sp. YE78]SFW28647.1 hypothetical protein SAMN02910447_01406 [Ruminococcus sp. YE71]
MFYTVLILTIVIIGSLLLYFHIRHTVEKKLRSEVTSLALQMATTVNNFTASAELDCTEAFRSGCATDFDPISGQIEEYEAQAAKTEMKNRLLGLSAGKNYNDFFFIYSDSETVGKVSSGTSELISRLGYELFSDRLGSQGDCWLYSPAVSSGKVFYLRRATDHSLFVLSFYAEKMETLFPDAELISNTYAVATEKNVIILSNEAGLARGTKIPSDISELFDDQNGESVLKNSTLGASVAVDAGWHVIVTLPSPIPDLPTRAVLLALVMYVAAAASLSWLVGLVAAAPFRRDEIKAEGNEFIDPITGKLNEYGLDENISEKIETSLVGSTYAFIVLGVKDPEQVRSAVSSKYWNDIRSKLIAMSEEFFAEKEKEILIGRTQGDRIVVFADFSEFDIFKAHRTLEMTCADFCSSFSGFSAGEDGALKLHVNVGVSVYPDSADDFDSLLEKASKAFLAANRLDGDSFVLYDPAKHESEAL